MRLTLNVIVDWLFDGKFVFVVPELVLIIVVIVFTFYALSSSNAPGSSKKSIAANFLDTRSLVSYAFIS